MTTGSVDSVKELRDRTGAGIMDCKAALLASSGDIEKAIDFLRKKGMSQAAKRAGREAKEGLIVASIDGKKAAIVEANCETDFVARTDDFIGLTQLALQEAFAHAGKIDTEKISSRTVELSGKIGEKILVRRAKLIQSDGALFTYIHSNNKIGVVVDLGLGKADSKNNATLAELGKNIAMQVAASNPVCIQRSEVPILVVDREKAIYKEEVKGKPDNIVEKIIQGKLEKFYQTNCLLEQLFIKDDKMTIQQLLNQTSKTLGDTVQIKQFVRFQLGETISS